MEDKWDKAQQGVSRRTFLRVAAAGAVGAAAAGALSACSPAGGGSTGGGTTGGGSAGGGTATPSGPSKELIKGLPAIEQIKAEETLDCDVLVIGGGASGCCTALRAAEEGAKVILVEKMSVLGGCYNLSWASCTVNSKYAPKDDPTFGIADPDAHIADWVADSHWRVDAAAIRQLLMSSGEAYDWLVDNYGLQLIPLGWGNGFMMLPDYAGRPGFWLEHVTAATEGKGGKLLLEHTAKSLVKTGDAVTGAIVADSKGKGIQINAKAVSIATGGYGGNYDLVLSASGFGGVNGGLTQNVGEGLAMAWDAGAWIPDNFGGLMLHQTLARATNDLMPVFDPLPAKYPMMVGYLPMLLNVGAKGTRFRDESLVLAAVPAAYSGAYQGPFHYVILSKKIIDALEAGGLAGIGQMAQPGMPPEFQPPDYTPETPWAGVYDVLDKAVEVGAAFKGETPEELAANAGMDVGIFSETYANYLKFTTEKKDNQFNKAAEFLLDYSQDGPLYAITTEQNNLCTWGGIQTSVKYEALKDDRTPVPGLYAAVVEAASNRFNDTYVGDGIGLANTVTSGYLCGKAMADYVKG